KSGFPLVPDLAFSKFLASKCLKNTILTTTRLTKSAKVSLSSSSISIQTISEDDQNQNETLDEYFQRLKRCLPQNLARFLDQQKESGSVARAIMYDSCFPWVLVYQNKIIESSWMKKSLYLINIVITNIRIFYMLLIMLYHIYICINLVIEWMSSRWPIKTISPTMSLLQTNEDFSDQKINDHMISIFEPTDEEAYTKWLDSKETNSIFYVSFGSVVKLEKEQMEELAFGLMMSNCNFLWVVRSSEENKLRIPPGFISNALDRSLLRMLIWKVGVRVRVGDIKREEIAKLVAEVVHGDKGKELKRNACKWKELVEEAVGKSGTSAKNVDDFVSHILDSYELRTYLHGLYEFQDMNAKFIEDVWKVGVRVRVGDIKREEIAKLVAEVVHGDKGKELKRNVCEWKELVEEAVGKSGTSAKNNAKFIEDVWKVGVRVRVGDIKREEIAKLVAEVVHGDKGKELKRNVCEWKELVEEAVGKGGSSAKNVEDFVSRILGS
ncbi:UDP-glycosyltransferase 74E1-like, partial [Henckelia pumila]|uniref:UDP-glycosyltransferase 74E1-like n=1 Tax=Henckelia pumila TaxID=405737 RepID=UPI003C6E00CC